MSNYIDVHVIKHPTQNRQESLDKLLKQLEKEPVKIHLVDGVQGEIGQGRAKGFRCGVSDYVSYVDDDDLIVPGVYDKILKCLNDNPHIDGCATREKKNADSALMNYPKFRYLYYEKRHFLRIHHITTYRRQSIIDLLPLIEGCQITAEHSLLAYMMLSNAVIQHIPTVGYVWQEHDGSTPSLNIPPCPKALDLYNRVLKNAIDLQKSGDNGSANLAIPGNRVLTKDDERLWE